MAISPSMRITSTTSVPVRAKDTTAAGPADAMTTPLPTNSPAPMTPPSAIICMWRRCSERRSPLGSALGRLIDSPVPATCTAASHEFLVLGEVPDGLGQRVTAERVAQLLGQHHLEHGGLAGALRRGRGAQRGCDIGEALDRHAVAAEGTRHGGPAGVIEIDALIAARIEIDVVLFFRPPLAVVEHHHRHADLFTGAGEQFVEADAPGAIADIGERRALRGRELRAADHREGIAAIAKTHGGEHR